MPTTSYPASRISRAVTALSTPPLIATTTFFFSPGMSGGIAARAAMAAMSSVVVLLISLPVSLQQACYIQDIVRFPLLYGKCPFETVVSDTTAAGWPCYDALTA